MQIDRRLTDGQWYKDAIVYAVDVSTFQDSNGDGLGDFPGLTSRLDYLADLGVTCLWLLPFYPTPDRDNGYDVADYMHVSPPLGGLEAFLEFREAAAARGLRVVIDLVVQHTSDEHPWFEASRAGTPPYDDYYVWTDERPEKSPATQILPGPETDIWTWDDVRGAWYLHQFYAFEPDLNVDSKAVQEEIRRIITRWLNLGVDGFRVDAASMAFGTEALLPEPDRQPYAFMRHLRACVNAHPRGGVLMAEAGIDAEKIDEYVGGNDGMHMVFTFDVTACLFLALAREETTPIARSLQQLPPLPDCGQWLFMLRNLDELNLDSLSEDEREEVFRAFAPDQNMRVYGRGIRRRLAPMLGGELPRIQLALSLALTMPGTPMIAYGDEIGMGDDLRLPERQPVRTPMQWTSALNAGFSTARSGALHHPIVDDGQFDYRRVNVAAQSENPDSLLHWVQHAVAMRRDMPEIGRGRWCIVPTSDTRVLAIEHAWQDQTCLTIHNVSGRACTVSLNLGQAASGNDAWRACLSDQPLEPAPNPERLSLAPYGYRWLRRERSA